MIESSAWPDWLNGWPQASDMARVGLSWIWACVSKHGAGLNMPQPTPLPMNSTAGFHGRFTKSLSLSLSQLSFLKRFFSPSSNTHAKRLKKATYLCSKSEFFQILLVIASLYTFTLQINSKIDLTQISFPVKRAKKSSFFMSSWYYLEMCRLELGFQKPPIGFEKLIM